MTRALNLRLSGDPSEARKLRNELHRWLLDAGINGRLGHDIVLAADEAFSNAIQHPINRVSRDITISAEIHNKDLTVRIADQGQWQTSADPNRAHYGQQLMHQLMDSVEIDQHHTGTTVILHKTVPSRPTDSI
jgi:anti-sigma regulatory factor (Ser/Thr protein kinase)